jgi:uncharacterized protein involved in type VI secretion and phage assembly
VKIDGAGPAAGSYLVSEVEHRYDGAGFHTHFVAGAHRPSGLVDTLGGPAPDPGLTIHGLVIGIVTNNSDPTDSGRLKVRFAGVDGTVESDWARVLTLGGGAQRGTVFLPEVNDEVLVGFEHGDSRRAVVLGGLFSKKNGLPSSGSGVANSKVDFRRITSRLGHVVELADGDGPAAQHILLQLGNVAHRLRLGADRFDVELAAGKPVTIKSGAAKFEIGADGGITISGKTITLEADKELSLQSKGTAKLTSSAGMNLDAGQLELAAKSTASVKGNGAVAIKGGQVAIN